MSGIHYILPMGGGGTRFGNSGYELPKPLIPLHSHPFFYWAAQSIYKFYDVIDITFVILKDHADRFGLDKEILKYYPDAKIVYLDHVLNGAVLTCLEGVKEIKDDAPILFNDCDHAFFIGGKNLREFGAVSDNPDGALLTFKSDNPAFSYCMFDENGRVKGTVEKEVVSNDAICGAYYFKNRQIFESMANEYLDKCSYKEFFISGVYNVMAEHGMDIRNYPIDLHIPFGTPDEHNAAMQREDEFKQFISDSFTDTSV